MTIEEAKSLASPNGPVYRVIFEEKWVETAAKQDRVSAPRRVKVRLEVERNSSIEPLLIEGYEVAGSEDSMLGVRDIYKPSAQ